MNQAEDEGWFRPIHSILCTPVIGDVLDVFGYWHQVLPQVIEPLHHDMRLVGRALQVQIADGLGRQEHPIGKMTDASTRSFLTRYTWLLADRGTALRGGEIVTAAARMRKGAGQLLMISTGILRACWSRTDLFSAAVNTHKMQLFDRK